LDDLKNSLDLSRLRNHNTSTIKGKIFIMFVAQIVIEIMRRSTDSIPAKKRNYLR